jgi:hypothetical protein
MLGLSNGKWPRAGHPPQNPYITRLETRHTLFARACSLQASATASVFAEAIRHGGDIVACKDSSLLGDGSQDNLVEETFKGTVSARLMLPRLFELLLQFPEGGCQAPSIAPPGVEGRSPTPPEGSDRRRWPCTPGPMTKTGNSGRLSRGERPRKARRLPGPTTRGCPRHSNRAQALPRSLEMP